jgi:two-component system sensor histidine kinase TctE
MTALSLRTRLLRQILPPIVVLLLAGVGAAYFATREPAAAAYDQALGDIAIALGERIGFAGGVYSLEIAAGTERALRTDRYDTIYYRVLAPDGRGIAGDEGLPPPPANAVPRDSVIAYDAEYQGRQVRVVALLVPCAGSICTVEVAETTNKRRALVRGVLVSSLLPGVLIALATLAIVGFGVKRGLDPLGRLSDEIKSRSPGDLRPVDLGHAPEEAAPIVGALNGLFGELTQANRRQQRFLANAAHQLRTPLAGLQAHTELALAQPVPEACRAELEQVHSATVRTARLANQLLALARIESGELRPGESGNVNLRQVVEDIADEWVRRALAKDIDLGFQLEAAQVRGDAFLLREALVNLVHNAIEYTQTGGVVTVKCGLRAGKAGAQPYLEVEDNGRGIPPVERERVLERFYRVPGTPGTGSGLGLAIVCEIAAAHDAIVEIGDGLPNPWEGMGCKVALLFPPVGRAGQSS